MSPLMRTNRDKKRTEKNPHLEDTDLNPLLIKSLITSLLKVITKEPTME
jgi:hypothetical protein